MLMIIIIQLFVIGIFLIVMDSRMQSMKNQEKKLHNESMAYRKNIDKNIVILIKKIKGE